MVIIQIHTIVNFWVETNNDPVEREDGQIKNTNKIMIPTVPDRQATSYRKSNLNAHPVKLKKDYIYVVDTLWTLQWEYEIRKHSKSWLVFSYSPNYLENWTIRNPDVFVQISNSFWQNGNNFSRFKMVGLLGFRSWTKSRQFETQPLFDLSKSRLVRISNPHCIKKWGTLTLTILVGCWS